MADVITRKNQNHIKLAANELPLPRNEAGAPASVFGSCKGRSGILHIIIQPRNDFHCFRSVVGSERRIFSATECVSAVQGNPRSLILAPIERAYATSY